MTCWHTATQDELLELQLGLLLGLSDMFVLELFDTFVLGDFDMFELEIFLLVWVGDFVLGLCVGAFVLGV